MRKFSCQPWSTLIKSRKDKCWPLFSRDEADCRRVVAKLFHPMLCLKFFLFLLPLWNFYVPVCECPNCFFRANELFAINLKFHSFSNKLYHPAITQRFEFNSHVWKLISSVNTSKYFHKNNRIIPGVPSRVKSNHQSREIKTKPHLIDVMWRQGNVRLEQYFLKPTTVKWSFNICALNRTLEKYMNLRVDNAVSMEFRNKHFLSVSPKTRSLSPRCLSNMSETRLKMFTFSSFPFLALCTKRSRSFLHSFVDLTLKWTVVKPRKLRQRVTKSNPSSRAIISSMIKFITLHKRNSLKLI